MSKQNEHKRKPERVVFNSVVRQQHHPIFEVTAAGHCVEFTDKRSDAHAAFADCRTYPKQLSIVSEFGKRTLIEQVLA